MRSTAALIAIVVVVIGLSTAALLSANHPDACKSSSDANSISENKRSAEALWCPATWGAVTFLTFALVIVGGVQTVVFGVQARKLAETIDTMKEISRDQSKDVRDSIAQATRAAVAMEGMSAGMIKNIDITTEIASTQREFGQLQMRAYQAVYYGTVVPQDNATGWRTEVRLQLVNNGHTPAYEVSYQANADVLPFPLPEHFDFPIPDIPAGSKSVIGSGRDLMISCALPTLLSVEQVEEYTNIGTSRIYMWGIATYKDVFKVPHETKFCQSVIWLRNGNTMGVNTRRHNEAN